MSHPILYSPTETNFDHSGIGVLEECMLCEVTEERNGAYELVMKYPLDGTYYNQLKDRSLVKVELDKFRGSQVFRIYSVSKPLNGIVTFSAQHLSYDLSGIPTSPFSADMADDALSGLGKNAVTDCPFSFWTDKSTKAKFEIFAPASIRSRLGGVSGSILDVYGGEYEFDNYTIKLHDSRGKNRGVRVLYGVNMTDIKQDENCANVYTGILPYWNADEGVNLVMLPEKVVKASGEYNFEKIKVVDFSDDFEVEPTEAELRSAAEKYIKGNSIGVPSVSLKVSFEQLDKDAERVGLCDTVNVEFPALKVNATAKVVKTVYDVLLDRMKSVTLGNAKTNIADTINDQMTEIDNIKDTIPSKTDLEKAVENATDWITNGNGYMIAIKDDLGNWKEICSLDTPNIETAVNVWRWNNGGFGHSSSGYDGPYETAITQDGQIVADFITAGGMSAERISTGTLKSKDGNVGIDLDSGSLSIKAKKYSTVSTEYTFSHNEAGELIITYTGEKPNYSIDEDGNLVLTYTGEKPDIWADENGYILTTEENLGTSVAIGELKTEIDGKGTWNSEFIQNGERVSALYFDFEKSRFTFDGHVVARSGEIGGCSIVGGKLQVPAANINGTLTIGNLPSGVAMIGDIPSNADITKITNDTISTTNVIAKNLQVDAANVSGILWFTNGHYIDTTGNSERIVDLPGLKISGDGISMAAQDVVTGDLTADECVCGELLLKDDRITEFMSLSPQGIRFYTYGDIESYNGAINITGTWHINGSAWIPSSDARLKNTIEDFTPAHDILFDHLRPRTYKWNEGTSGRTHSGFIVQEVVDAVEKAGLTTKDFAAVVNFKGENGEDGGWGLRYEEMISLNTWQVQKLKFRIAELEKKLEALT